MNVQPIEIITGRMEPNLDNLFVVSFSIRAMTFQRFCKSSCGLGQTMQFCKDMLVIHHKEGLTCWKGPNFSFLGYKPCVNECKALQLTLEKCTLQTIHFAKHVQRDAQHLRLVQCA